MKECLFLLVIGGNKLYKQPQLQQKLHTIRPNFGIGIDFKSELQ